MKFHFNGRTVDPRNDYVFKKILGNPEHPDLPLDFLNGLMRQLGRPQFREVAIANPVQSAEFLDGKDIVVDINAVADDNTQFQIEMQIKAYAALPLRMLDNWSRLFSQQIKKGDSYHKHQPLYAIWLVDESVFRDDPAVVTNQKESTSWLRHFELRDQTGRCLHPYCNIIVIDLAVWRKSLSDSSNVSKIDKELESWVTLVGQETDVVDYETGLRKITNPAVREAVKIMYTFTKADEEFFLQETIRNAEWEREELLKEAREEAREQGLSQGIQQGHDAGLIEGIEKKGISVARLMLDEGFSNEKICQLTGLTMEQIENLRKR